MVSCFNVACFFCTLCVFIGLSSLAQFCLGIYLTFIETDINTINRLIKTDKFDSYLAHLLLVSIGLGLISFLLTFLSIYGMVKQNRSLSLFVAVLWVFSVALNLVMFTILFLYYYLILPQIHPSLIHSLQKAPSTTSSLLDKLQSKYSCCGIDNEEDYKNITLHSLPASCCRMSNCWQDTTNNNSSSNNTTSLMHTDGCYPVIIKYVTIELWTLVGITGLCALLQILTITLICVLNQRYKKLDDNPKFAIDQLIARVPINGMTNNNNNNIQSSSKTKEETVEITQI